jgi:hypothetical protein
VRPHVVLEGADCTGKTSIAQDLVERFGYRYHHEGPPPPGEKIFDRASRLLLAAHAPTVFDRLYLGEAVYGPILRGQAQLDFQQVKVLNRLAHGVGAILVLCQPAYEVSLAAWKSGAKAELLEDEATYKKVWAKYENYRQSNVFDFTAKLMQLPRHLLDPKPPFRLPDRYVGSPTATFLVVGERSNGPFDLPFHAGGGSSLYLNECLAAAGYQESELALVNAFRQDGMAETLARFPYTIALGNDAFDACKAQGRSPGIKVPHPAYWKRFHTNDRHEYVKKLKKVRDDFRQSRGGDLPKAAGTDPQTR